MKFAGIVGVIGPELPLLGALLAGCDAGEELDTTKKAFSGSAAVGGNGVAGNSAADGGGDAQPTFTNVYATFTRGCGCHVAGKGGLDMSTRELAYTNLVGVSSAACPSYQRVAASDPAHSVLLQSLNHGAMSDCTPPAMPKGMNATMMSAAELQLVEAWITAGAPND